MYDESRLEPELMARLLFEWTHPKIAARCRTLSLPYPPMTPDGDLAANPFAGSSC